MRSFDDFEKTHQRETAILGGICTDFSYCLNGFDILQWAHFPRVQYKVDGEGCSQGERKETKDGDIDEVVLNANHKSLNSCSYFPICIQANEKLHRV